MTFTIDDVVARGLCIGCGACSARTGGAVSVTIGRFGVFQADLAGASASDLAAASKVCPMSDDAVNEDVLASERFGDLPHSPQIGHYRAVLAGQVTDDAAVSGSSSGGMTTVVLQGLLERGEIDGVLHVGRGDSGSMFEYVISTTVEQLTASRKSIYYSTTLASVLASVRGDGKVYAVVGVPCFIKSARLLAREVPELAVQFPYFVGLVCGHLKSQFFAESLGWQAGIGPGKLGALDFRVKNPERKSSSYDYAAAGTGGGAERVRPVAGTIDGSWAYGAFQPEGCNFCDDVFAETADVVLGDAWLPEYTSDWRGTNVVVVRNRVIGKIIDDAISVGVIKADVLSPETAASSQAGNFRHRHTGLQVRLADDLRAGLKIPVKRIKPGYGGVARTRRALIRQRRALSRLSLVSFVAAREASDLTLYTHPMSAAIRQYRIIDSFGRGPAQATKTIAKILLGRS